MKKYFTLCKQLAFIKLPRLAARHFSTEIRHFPLNTSHHYGKLLKITPPSTMTNPSNYIAEKIFTANPNSLVIVTMPTGRFKNSYMDAFYPGHNFSLITDDKGKVQCSLSKRPDMETRLGERQRVSDARFFKQSHLAKIFSALFTTWEQEIEHFWAKKAAKTAASALYMHIIPLHDQLSAETYQARVNEIKNMATPYCLHGTVTTMGDFIRASNCNNATAEAICPDIKTSTEEMFCQQAVMAMMDSFVEPGEYLQRAFELGLTEGIEIPAIEMKEVKLKAYC